jgi:anti-sigma B factor antagonist
LAALSVDVHREGDTAVVEVVGELDLAAEAAFARSTEALSAPTVVLDLSGVTFMDSTGLRLVLEMDARVRDAGGRCVVVRGSGSVHRLIEQGLLASRLEVVNTLTDVR